MIVLLFEIFFNLKYDIEDIFFLLLYSAKTLSSQTWHCIQQLKCLIWYIFVRQWDNGKHYCVF